VTTNRSIPDAVVIPELAYPDVGEAAAWLCRVFGFKAHLLIGNHRAQLTFPGGGALIVIELPDSEGKSENARRDHAVMVRVADAYAHYEHAREQGARILREPTDYPYGERQYNAEDIGGHVWTFSQSIADIDPATWGGELVENHD
jgi:uncharacterized glyoxalase superfamily protein PhnB